MEVKNGMDLREEVICDFYVTSKRKKVWMVELQLLERFIDVCKKYDLKYFADSGTLLGAVRHNGFIPWDDDIDVGMPRDDYNKLLKIAKEEFKDSYFLQTSFNDRIFRAHAQLRDSNTTGILPKELEMDFNQGIFIDIFPFDELPKGKITQFFHEKAMNFIQLIIEGCYGEGEGIKGKIIKKTLSTPMYRIFGGRKMYSYFEKVCSKYNGKGTGLVCNFCFYYKNRKNLRKKEDLYELVEHRFEYLNIMIPKRYDKILKKLYGDYKKCKKVETSHGSVLFDTERSYIDFKKDYKNGKVNLEDYYLQ